MSFPYHSWQSQHLKKFCFSCPDDFTYFGGISSIWRKRARRSDLTIWRIHYHFQARSDRYDQLRQIGILRSERLLYVKAKDYKSHRPQSMPATRCTKQPPESIAHELSTQKPPQQAHPLHWLPKPYRQPAWPLEAIVVAAVQSWEICVHSIRNENPQQMWWRRVVPQMRAGQQGGRWGRRARSWGLLRWRETCRAVRARSIAEEAFAARSVGFDMIAVPPAYSVREHLLEWIWWRSTKKPIQVSILSYAEWREIHTSRLALLKR